MPVNMNDYNTGYDAFVYAESFDTNKSQDWQDGYLDAQADDAADCAGAC